MITIHEEKPPTRIGIIGKFSYSHWTGNAHKFQFIIIYGPYILSSKWAINSPPQPPLLYGLFTPEDRKPRKAVLDCPFIEINGTGHSWGTAESQGSPFIAVVEEIKWSSSGIPLSLVDQSSSSVGFCPACLNVTIPRYLPRVRYHHPHPSSSPSSCYDPSIVPFPSALRRGGSSVNGAWMDTRRDV